ncbi:MAG: hypothetical protein R2764_12410 [Bacteroidales bacterium]
MIALLTGIFSSCVEDDLANPQSDRDKFIGAWDVNENCQRISYSVTIEADPTNSAQVILKNFWLIGYQEEPPYAIVAGNNIVIPKQYIANNKDIEVTGSGNYSDEEITWNFTVNDGADLYTCDAFYEKP